MTAQLPSMNKNSVRHSYCFYDCYLYRLTVRFCPSSLVFCPFICLLLLHVIPLFFCSVRIDYFKKIIIQNRTLRAYKNTFTYINSQNSFSLLNWHSSSKLSISADQTNSRCLESQVFLLQFPVLFGENTASSRFISHSRTDLGQFYAWETKRVSHGSLCTEGFWRLAVVLLLYQHPGTQKRKSSANTGPDKPRSLRSGIKSKCEVLIAQVCPTLCEPTDCSPPGSSVHGVLQARILEWVPSLLQGIFLTQGWKPTLLHCRQILYGLSHPGELWCFCCC